MVLAAFFWGSGHPVIKTILRQPQPHLDSIQIAFLTSVIGFIILSLFIAASRRTRDLRTLDRRGLVVAISAGLLQFGIYPVLSYTALSLIPASLNALLVGTSPLLIALLSLAVLREKLAARGYVGIVVAFLGVGVLLWGGFDPSKAGPLSFLGVGLAMTGAFVVAAYAVMGRYLMRKQDAIIVNALGNLFGAVFLAPVTGLVSGFAGITQSSLISFILLIYWGVALAIANVLFYFSLKRMQAARIGVFIFVSPMAATLLSVVILREALTILFLVGMLLIFVGIRLTQSR